MNRLLLVDAYAMIYRAYYAFIRVPRINSKEENTSAIYGFVITLEELLKKLQPTHIAVAFDPHGNTFRHEAYAAYKAQREQTPEDIRRAIPIIKQILQAMRIPMMEVPGFEADDVIGTMATQAEKEGFEVFMATPDKDYGQLVTEHIFQYRPRHLGGYEQLGAKEICDKYGLQSTTQVIDLLGLMGDASDNIPGCKGVGEKTAVSLLTQYHSIENLLQHVDELKGTLKQKIASQQQDILFSKFLATIRTDIPAGDLSWKADDLLLQEKDWNQLIPLYEALEFTSLLKHMPAKQRSVAVGKKVEGTLDLFASDATTPDTGVSAPQFDTIENRLCAYLLNPEVSFNPNKEPDWEALRQDTALWNLYNEVELPLVPVLREMEQVGVRLDTQILHEAEVQLTDELTRLEQQINELAGQPLNVNSPAQVGEILFDKMKLDPKAKRNRNGHFSTPEEVLQGLKDKHPIVPAILEQRELKKLITTYITALPTYINGQTGKIHTTYNQTVTATGRLSSSNPNLQNLPIRSERGQVIRQAVIPDEGCLILSADYSQIELRLMAHMAQDPHLIEAFRSGQDIHAATAARIFHKPLDTITRDERRRAKTANFGIIYGISAFGLAQQLECPRSEAKQLIDEYFAAFPQVIDYIEKQKQFARENGYVQTLFGRKRYLPDILSHNSTVRSFAERNAVNAPIQGTAADIIKMAMVSIHTRIKEQGLKAQMIMQVHDELNFNVPENEVDILKTMVVSEMQNVVHLMVPLIAECGIGHNWLEAH